MVIDSEEHSADDSFNEVPGFTKYIGTKPIFSPKSQKNQVERLNNTNISTEDQFQITKNEQSIFAKEHTINTMSDRGALNTLVKETEGETIVISQDHSLRESVAFKETKLLPDIEAHQSNLKRKQNATLSKSGQYNNMSNIKNSLGKGFNTMVKRNQGKNDRMAVIKNSLGQGVSSMVQNNIKKPGSQFKMQQIKTTLGKGLKNLVENNLDQNQGNIAQLGRSTIMDKSTRRKSKLATSQVLDQQLNELIQLQSGKCVSGFDVGEAKAQGSFFSSLRQQQFKSKDSRKFEDTTDLKGEKFIEMTMKQQQNSYEKKFAFEKGIYHQCIPNPKNTKQRITVQLVDRTIKENDIAGQLEKALISEIFMQDQQPDKALSQTYGRFNLTPVDDEYGESDDEDADENNQADDENSLMTTKRMQRQQKDILKSTMPFGQVQQKLFSDKSLFQPVSKLLGIQNQHYADIQQNSADRLSALARKNCDNFAVIAFWDLTELNTFKCNRFFIVPSPHKRAVIDQSGKQIYRVLYASEHTGDLFFFYKGSNKRENEDMVTIDQGFDEQEQVFNIGFLKLDHTQKELQEIGENRLLNLHCSSIKSIESDSILSRYLEELHELKLENQNQMPDITVLDQPMNKENIKGLEGGKLIVFTAFLLQEESKSSYTSIKDNWYPTIYFYSLDEQCTIWQLYGGEQFIGASNQKVYFLTNSIWSEMEDEHSWMMEQENFTRHENFYSFVKKCNFGTNPIYPASFEDLQQRAFQPQCFEYRMIFDQQNNLEKTDAIKAVSAHLHQDNKRVTLVYKGIGSFTFLLKRACSLTNTSLWSCQYKASNFNCHLTFDWKKNTITGEGKNEHELWVEIDADLNPNQEMLWEGHIESDDIHIDLGCFDLLIASREQKTVCVSSDWENQQDQVLSRIEGELGKLAIQKGEQNIKFTLSTTIKGKRVALDFIGTIDLLKSKIIGTAKLNEIDLNTTSTFSIELTKIEQTPGKLILKIGDKDPIEKDIVVDFNRKTIECADGTEKDFKLTAVEAVDQAELIYTILREDVTLVRAEEKTYIQAKLVAAASTDVDSKGEGVSEASVVIYNIDEAIIDKKEKNLSRKKAAEAPRDRYNLRFYLDQSFLRTQKEAQMWHVEPSFRDIDQGVGKIYGAVLYEELGSDQVRLNMFSAKVERDDNQHLSLDYFQEPVQQSWTVDYPLLAYKTFTPRNKEIAIAHLAYNMPQKFIHLGEWEFVCFVNHTQMVEQKCFKKSKETNCDIMFLVKRADQSNSGFEKCRLMSFKCNPWLQYHEEVPEDGDFDIYKQSLFIFSGDIGVILTEDYLQNKIEQNLENHKKFAQRFNNDKIQSCELITKTLGTYEQFMLIIQFNDCIVQASLNRNFFKLVCQSREMVRRHLVRGYNEKVFYAESTGKVDKILQIDFHPTKHHEIQATEIYQLTAGALVAFEPDDQNIGNDFQDYVQQSFFVMDDQQKIYLIQNEDNVRYVCKKVIDFSRHKIVQEIYALRSIDWVHVHISLRTLTMGGKTFNLNTSLKYDQKVPNSYFGQQQYIDPFAYLDEESDNSDDTEAEIKNEDDWKVETQQGMPMTTNIIMTAQKNQREFCFVIKPAPGSRRISIVGFQQLNEIETMLFVTNQHVLVKFRGGKVVTLLSNGSIIQQNARVQQLLEKSERILGESQIFKGNKYLLLEAQSEQEQADDQGRENSQSMLCVALQFESTGLARCVGIYDDYKKQINDQVKQSQDSNSSKDEVSHSHSVSGEVREKNSVSEPLNLRINARFSHDQENQTNHKKSKNNSKRKKNRVMFAKEFFITEKGEIIKMAAMVTQNPDVKAKLEARDANEQKVRKDGDKKFHYMSICKINNNEDMQEAFTEYITHVNAFTVVVFHTLNEETQMEFVENTQYCVVGNYLCHRKRFKHNIWVSKLKENVDALIQTETSVNRQKFIAGDDFKRYESVCLSITKMMAQFSLQHVQLTEVPKAYFTTIKHREANTNIKFYDNLLQVTIGTGGIIFDLDSNPIREVNSIENIDQLQKPDQCVNTGFIMSVSNNIEDDEVIYRQRTQIITNEYCNLIFEKKQFRSGKGRQEKQKTEFLGMLFRNFSSVDLQELNQIQQAVNNRTKIKNFDPEAMLCQYEGHTIFSLFFDRIKVYEKILEQLKGMEFESEEDIDGHDVENNFLRRLYRIMSQPTGDLHHFSQKYDTENSLNVEKERIKRQQTLTSKADPWILRMCKGNQSTKSNPRQGFKSILKKSLYFSQSRFRDTLMEIAILCKENSISDFVENQQDIKILFVSMSPSIIAQFENAFRDTKHTQAIHNADWRLGEKIQVIGKMSSIITEEDANKLIIQKQKKLFSNEGDVQNRQIVALQLPIDWIFAPVGDEQKIGFAEFIVALAQAPHESLFSTDLIKTIVKHFWDRFYRSVMLKCFLPFLVYFLSTLWYISNFAVSGVADPSEFGVELIVRYMIVILILYLLYYEIRCCIRDKFAYLLDIYNWIDISSFCMNLYIVYYSSKGTLVDTDEGLNMRTIAPIAVVLIWTKSFYWLRLFSQTSFFVRLITDTLYDIRYFLILFLLILMTFGNAILILSENRENPLYKDYTSSNYVNVIFSQYEMALGEFYTETYSPGQEGGDTIAWVLFCFTTMVSQVMFLNMLIAIMGDTFDRNTECKEQSALVEQIRIIADFVHVVPAESIEKGTLSRFLFAFRPKSMISDEDNGWTGTTKVIKLAIESHSSTMGKQIRNLQNLIHGQVSTGFRKVDMLEERMSELTGASQRQQVMIEQVLSLLKEQQQPSNSQIGTATNITQI